MRKILSNQYQILKSMEIIETKGNKKLMDKEKTLFICSKRTPIELYDYVFKWTDCLDQNNCIACFNSTEMESEVLQALLVAKVPTVLFVMNRFTDVNNVQIINALQENRILIVVLRRDEPKTKGATPKLRNKYVLSICQHVVCGYVNKNGSVYGLLAGRQNVVKLINDNIILEHEESDTCHERWTVAQDKMLLQMYYGDMGIHAIHKRLNKTYTAVYARIRSITQPEELLKGREFEDYVLSMFNIREGGNLVLQEWQGDKKSAMILPENNSNPDFVFRYKHKKFAVECKWREKLSTDLGKDLFTEKKIEDYSRFSKTRNIPVTLVLGIGGEPCYPELLYIIPLERIPTIVSNHLSISEYLYTSSSLIPSLFIPKKDKFVRKVYSMEEKIKKYPNAYKPWTLKDDEKLISLVKEQKSINEIAVMFKRNNGAIVSRIKKLLNKNKLDYKYMNFLQR